MRNYNRNIFTFIIGLLLCFVTYSYGQKNIVFSNLTVRDGLSSHVVYAIESDDDDMIWTISAKGIDRFDGKEFKHYDLKRRNGAFINNLNVNSGLFKDSKGIIWVYNQYGVYFYNNVLDKFEASSYYNSQFEDEKPCIAINEVDGTLLFFSWQSVVSWDRNSKETKLFSVDFNANTTCSYRYQGILIGTKKGLKIFKNNKFEDFQLYGNSLKEANISSLYLHPNGTIWIGTRHKGMFMIRNNEISHLSSSGPYTIMDIMRYRGKVLVATDGGGILDYNDKGELIKKFNNTASNLNGLGVYDLHKDDKGRLWVASYGVGIFYYYPNKTVTQTLNGSLLKGFGAKLGHEIYKDSDGRILLGTDKGLIVDADSESPKILTISDFEGVKSDNSNFVINNIVEDDNGNYWVSSFGHGMFSLNKKTLKVNKHLTSLSVDGKEESIRFTLKLVISNGVIYLRQAKGNLYSYDYKRNTAQRLRFKNVTFIKEDKNNNGLFISTATASYFYKNNKSVKLFDYTAGISEYVNINDSLSLIGTLSSGIKIFDYKNDSLYDIKYRKGLPSSIGQILKENSKDYVVLADNKVFRVEISVKEMDVTQMVEIYDRFEVIKGASMIVDNRLIIGGFDGFLELPNYSNRGITLDSKIIFDELEVEGKKITPDNSSILTKRIDRTKSLSLPYPYRDFRIKLVSPNYLDKTIYYSWKLVGYDTEFSGKTSYNTISYNNLPSGNYILRVKSYAAFNKAEIASKSIKINILPPFWLSTWAYLFYVLVLVLVAFATIKYFVTVRKQRNLRKRNKLFAEIAHEIRTPLTLINGPLQQLEKEECLSETARRLLKGVGYNLARLNSRVSQLLDFERSQNISDNLHITQFDLIKFIDELLVDFAPLLEQRNISLKKHIPQGELQVSLDEDKVEKIVYNLISNAIKYSPDNSTIEITLEPNENNWTFSVKDMGMGIPKKNQKNIFNRFYRADNAVKSGIVGSGIGLILSYKFAKLMGGEIVFESEQDKGTLFTLTLPRFLESDESYVPEDVSHYGDEFTKLSDKQYDYKIAIAEDNEDLRSFLKDALSENFKVEVFENGKVCYEGLLEDDYDLVLSDIMMPEMNGYELCDKIKGNIETSHLPIILLTALNASMYKAEGYEHGADHYVIKPFDIRMLKYRIISLIENRQKIKKLYQKKISTGETLEEVESPKPSIDTQFLEKLDELVLKNISDHEYGVQNICLDVGMSRPVLYRKLKALTNLSPKEYIQNKRLNLSKQLLEEGEKTISSIAYESGYSDPKYFSTAFKKKYGLSPSEYMKKYNKKD